MDLDVLGRPEIAAALLPTGWAFDPGVGVSEQHRMLGVVLRPVGSEAVLAHGA